MFGNINRAFEKRHCQSQFSEVIFISFYFIYLFFFWQLKASSLLSVNILELIPRACKAMVLANTETMLEYMRLCHSTQGINKSANFRFLQRLSVIFGFCRDFP